MVAAHNSDLQAAQQLGLQNRLRRPPDRARPAPDDRPRARGRLRPRGGRTSSTLRNSAYDRGPWIALGRLTRSRRCSASPTLRSAPRSRRAAARAVAADHRVLRTDTAAILLLDPRTDELVAHARRGGSRRRSSAASGSRSARASRDGSRPIAARSRSPTSATPTSSTRSCASAASGRCWACRCWSRAACSACCTSARSRRATSVPTDAELLQFAADRAAMAIAHARMYERERTTARMLEALQSVTDAALGYLPLDELLNDAARAHRGDPGHRHGRVPAARRGRPRARGDAAKGIEEEVEPGVRIPLGRGSRAGSRPNGARSRSPTSTTPTSSTRSCASAASARCSACRCWPRAA